MPCLAACAWPPLAPWTLLDAAVELHLLDEPLGVLGLAAGTPVHVHDTASGLAPWSAAGPGAPRDAAPLFAALTAATRCADPFRHRPWSIEEALA
jgi:capsular polysaccharide export protein